MSSTLSKLTEYIKHGPDADPGETTAQFFAANMLYWRHHAVSLLVVAGVFGSMLIAEEISTTPATGALVGYMVSMVSESVIRRVR